MEETVETGYHALPQPDELGTREKEDAMGAYLMMFASIGAGLPLPIINLIASVIYYFVNSKKSRYIKFHCHQSLFSQLPTSLMNAGLMFWLFQIFIYDNWEYNNNFVGYAVMVGVFNLAYFVLSIVGAVKARKGQVYYFLFFGRLAYSHAYKVRENDSMVKSAPVNQPPSM